LSADWGSSAAGAVFRPERHCGAARSLADFLISHSRSSLFLFPRTGGAFHFFSGAAGVRFEYFIWALGGLMQVLSRAQATLLGALR
jgi:hypothetical protein